MEFKREKSQNIYLLNKYHALIQYDIEFIVKVGNLLIATFLMRSNLFDFFRSFSLSNGCILNFQFFSIIIQLSRCNW